MNEKEIKLNIEKTYEISKGAYAPFSNFHVGALLFTKEGKKYEGINIENTSFGAGTCAERVAFGTAIANGEKNFTDIFVSSIDAERLLSPCGVCRQFMTEFVDEDFTIHFSDKNLEIKSLKISELMPFLPFQKGTLK